MKRSLPFLALSITLLATACGGNNSGDGGDGTLAAEDPQSVTGTVTWWDTSNESEGPAYDQLIEEFESQYPDITVERVAVSFDSAEQRFKTAAQSGDGAPDVLRSDVGWTAGLASLGYLQPLDGTMLLDEIDAFMEGPVEAASYDGEIFGVPQVTDTLGLIYNRELFDQAGIEEPPETWDEFVEVAQTIEEETGVPGTQLNPEGYFTLPMIYGEGGDILDTESETITVNSSAAVSGIQRTVEMVDSGVSLEPAGTDGYVAMQTAFKDGRIAMVINGPWSTGDSLDGEAFEDPENLGIAPIPAGPQDRAAPIGGHHYSVFRGSENKDATYLFIRHMTSSESQEFTSVETNTLPTRWDSYSDAVTSDPVKAEFQDAMEFARPRPAVPGIGDMLALFDQHYVEILRGTDTQAGLDELAEEWQSTLVPEYSID